MNFYDLFMKDYFKINQSILDGRALNKCIQKNKFFRDYLLKNSVFYFYFKELEKKENKHNSFYAKIDGNFQELQKKFYKTLVILEEIHKKSLLNYILFKTYKHIPEVVDGDIDILVEKKDFNKWIENLKEYGFSCKKVQKFKAECVRIGYCKVEPRVDVSFDGLVIFKHEVIQKFSNKVRIGLLKINSTSPEIDFIYSLFNLFLGPNYLKLYLLKLYFICDKEKIVSILSSLKQKKLRKHINSFITKKIDTKEIINYKFPYMPSIIYYLKWWLFYYLGINKISLEKKIKNLVFYFYLKINLEIFHKAYFYHIWFD